ncbi:MAG: hypothetical protein IJU56_01090 [Clostridia bacterium]|nr:hypothetical protein [Clostridia bacterium]
MNRAAARFKNEAALRFSRGNLPRDPAAGPRTANAARKAFRKAHIKKGMVCAVHSNGAVTVFSFPRKMRLRPTLRFYVRLAVHDLTRHRANLRARFPSAFAARCHPLQRRGQDGCAFSAAFASKQMQLINDRTVSPHAAPRRARSFRAHFPRVFQVT